MSGSSTLPAAPDTMRYFLPVIPLAFLFACQQPVAQQQPPVVKDTPAIQALPPAVTTLPAEPVVENEPDEAIGISGDFNGDGIIDSAWREVVRMSEDGDEPHIFAVKFNSAAIPPMKEIQNRFRLIPEGDLNGDGIPEMSIFHSPLHGTVHSIATWTLAPDGWKRIAGPWMVPTAGEYMSDSALRARIVLENDTVYYWQEDVEDENFTLRKQVLQLTK